MLFRVPVVDVISWIKRGDLVAVESSAGWRVHRSAAEAFFVGGGRGPAQMQIQTKSVLSIQEAAVYIGVSVVEVQHLVAEGSLRVLKVGSHVRVHKNAIDAMFQ
jgi:excisionase family DNA binding protein